MKFMNFYIVKDGIRRISNWKEIFDLYENNDFDGCTIIWDYLLISKGLPIKDLVESQFIFVEKDNIITADSELTLHDYYEQGVIREDTIIWGENLPAEGIPYSRFANLFIKFSPSISEFIESRKNHQVTILSGMNNSGKSLTLKVIRRTLGYTSNIHLVNRFYHIDRLPLASESPIYNSMRFIQTSNAMYQNNQNYENSDNNLSEFITKLSDIKRNKFFELCSKVFNQKFEIQHVDNANEFSQRYVSIDNQPLIYSSTGTRLILLLIAALFDEDFNYQLIDEPEIGLSPSLQTRIANIFFDKKYINENFPHISGIFLTTHSHIFLDKQNINNNFVTHKTGNQIIIKQIETITDYFDLNFHMLGNSLSHIFLPQAILIVEGETDCEYLKAIVANCFPKLRISIIKSHGDGGIKEKIHELSDVLHNIPESPYANRIHIIIDLEHSSKISDWVQKGIDRNNIHVLDKNGIEYYYPEEVMCEIFHCGNESLMDFCIRDDSVTINNISKTKKELNKLVIEKISNNSKYSQEFEKKILQIFKNLS